MIKRWKKKTVYHVIEGKAEGIFLEYLKLLYCSDPKLVEFSQNIQKGGNPDQLIADALKNSGRDRCLVWIDEDVAVKNDTRQALAHNWHISEPEELIICPIRDLQARFNQSRKKPVLVVSRPVCFEGFILRILGKEAVIPESCQNFSIKTRGREPDDLKAAFDNVLGEVSPLEYYKTHLSHGTLERKRKSILELDLLIESVTI